MDDREIERRRKISEKAKKRWATPGFKEKVKPKLSAGHKGKPWSDKQREAAPARNAKISAAISGQKWSEERFESYIRPRRDPSWVENQRQKNLTAYQRSGVMERWKEGQSRAAHKWITEGTSIEIAVRTELVRRNVNFTEQFILEGCCVDFYLVDRNLVIECDGDYWHSLPTVAERDARKEVVLRQAGIGLVRLTESEINADVKKAVDRALAAIK